KGGQTVPIKFEIFIGSVEQTTTSSVSSLQVFKYASCTAGVDSAMDPADLTATGGTVLRDDGTSGQFIYNWQTPKPANTCYKFTMTTQDGSSLSAFFKTK